MEEPKKGREARAAALRQTIDEALARLSQQLAEGHTAEFKRLLVFWARFHRYSHANVVLILSQRPDATRVAGYRTWRRVGRQVKRGAKAISIWCPIIKSVEDPDTGMPIELCVGFSSCPVFAAEDLVDIETNPLPTLWPTLPDDVDALYQRLKHRVEAAGYPVREMILPPGRQGTASMAGQITLATGLDSRNRTMALLHELAHQLEHFKPERAESPRDQRELEAEAAAAVVCAMVGLEHPTARDYLLMYHADVEGLKASLGVIHRLVGQMAKLLELDRLPQETAAPLAAD
ncbi:MAG: ArdC family protein [Thermomicrobiales bacterium]